MSLLNINIFIASYLLPSSHQYFSANTSCYPNSDDVSFNEVANAKDYGISASDRSINYGDGCFTTMYCENGNVFILNKHLERLAQDADKLGIILCISTVKSYLLEACRLFRSIQRGASVIKILVSRGSGGRAYEPPLKATPQVIISFYPIDKLTVSNKEMCAYKYSVQIAKMQLSTQPLLAGIKHLNRLEQVLAKQELQTVECDDLLLCNQSNEIVEATASNLFYLKNDVWFTPEIQGSGVRGVMRRSILEFMQEKKIEYQIKTTNVNDIREASSVFLCNAVKFIVPISNFYSPHDNVSYDVTQGFQILSNIHKWLSRENVLISKAS